MRISIFLITLLTFASAALAQQSTPPDDPLAHTFSIVARDTVTGDIGVAVQSHWFSVGTSVSWARAGVGAVATQSLVNASFGPRGLDLMEQGYSAQETLDSLLATDDGRAYRQVGIVDAQGRTAGWTGGKNIPKAGNITVDNFSVQANMMLNDTVWPAMAKAFRSNKGPLAERMVAALKAAQAEGGDIRGQQSAALIVVSGTSTGKPWVDRKIDLRVDDNPHAVDEIARLLKVHRAYQHMNNGDAAIEKNDVDKALEEYHAAMKMFPENVEMKYWTAVSLANVGRMDEALPIFKEVFKANSNWKKLTRRIVPNGMLQVSDQDLQRILNVNE